MTSTTRPSRLAAWYSATRPRVFVASFVPMGFAAVVALQDNVFTPVILGLALLGVMLLQTAANLVNEYADYRRGADTLKQAGQGMTIKNKVLPPEHVRNGAIVSVVGGSLIGIFILSQSGPLLWFIGIGGVLVAVTYTAGPLPLAYNGLGEVAAGIFMGPMIVLGAYYSMFPELNTDKAIELILLSFPVMLMTAAILHANNIRDLDADRSVNKRTLAVMLGLRFARIEYAVLVIGTYVSQIVLIVVGWMPVTTLLTFLTLTEAARLIRIINTETNPEALHAAQGATARLHGRIGSLLVIGWVVWLLGLLVFD